MGCVGETQHIVATDQWYWFSCRPGLKCSNVPKCVCLHVYGQTLVRESATGMFVPEETHLRVWTAPMRLELEFPRHPAAAPTARAGVVHVNYARVQIQVSQHFVQT